MSSLLSRHGASLPANEHAALLDALPVKWERLGELVLLPAGAFQGAAWAAVPASELWPAVAEALQTRKLARQAPVASTGTRSVRPSSPAVAPPHFPPNLTRGTTRWLCQGPPGVAGQWWRDRVVTFHIFSARIRLRRCYLRRLCLRAIGEPYRTQGPPIPGWMISILAMPGLSSIQGGIQVREERSVTNN